MVLGGTGAALTIPLNAIALAAVPPAKAGVASGIFNTARETGGCVGVALDERRRLPRPAHAAGHGLSACQRSRSRLPRRHGRAGVLTLGHGRAHAQTLRPKATVSVPAPRQVAEPTGVLAPSECSTECEIASTNAPTICVGTVMW